MRKSMFALSSVMIASLVLSACGGGNESGSPQPSGAAPSSDVKLNFWLQSYGDRAQQAAAMDEITAGFKQETGIEVSYDIIDWNSANQKYSLAMNGGESPDVAEYFFLSSFAKMGGENFGPMQINDIAAELDAENTYYPSALNETKIGDDYYGLPWRMDTRIMIYRKDHFEENGIEQAPKTWDELVETAEKLTVRNGDAITRSGVGYFVTRGDFTQSAMATMAQNDGAVLDFTDEKVTINEPNAVEALQFMQDLVKKHKVTSESLATPTTDSSTKFFTGEVSMLLGVNPDFLKTLEAQAPQLLDKVGFAELPSKSVTGNSSVLFAAPVSVFNSTKHPEEAKQFLKYFLRADNQVKLMKATGLINANKEVMQDEMYGTEWYAALAAQAERAVNGDLPVPYWSTVSAFPDGPVSSMVSKVLFGNDVQAAADESAASIEKIVTANQ
ncbi:ABC transporter substrate-binding protein [Paenibacillaceae bacterium WGS1546]|uniref:ABC transporter substrate-binding protein n=1 Tax=Cohnella sp. WGS1546 TaxID=3366810 RepID=UPI00372CFC92